MKFNLLLLIAALVLSNTALASDGTVPQSTRNHATFVRSAEIMAAVKRHDTGAFSDSVLRVVPIDSKYDVGVAVVRRSLVDGHMPSDALVHDSVTEIYQIIEGTGILVTGGTLQSAKPLTAAAVVGEIGPSRAGLAIVGGTRHPVGPHDIVVIPAGTPHGFVEISTPRIVYSIIRVDPQRILGPRGSQR